MILLQSFVSTFNLGYYSTQGIRNKPLIYRPDRNSYYKGIAHDPLKYQHVTLIQR